MAVKKNEIELSSELYISRYSGELRETNTHREVVGLDLNIDTKKGLAEFTYLTNNEDDEYYS